MKKLLIIALLVVSTAAYANSARCFGATCGSGTTDKISATITWPSKFSFFTWFYANSWTNNLAPRLWDVEIGGTFANSLSASTTGTVMQLSSTFSVTNGLWYMAVPATNRWHNIGITYDGSSTSNVPVVYMDGSPLSVTTTTTPSGTITTGAAVLSLGNRQTDSLRNFDGKMAHASFWTGVNLTANELIALSNGTSPLNIRPDKLMVYTPLYGANSEAKDWSPNHLTVTTTGTLGTSGPPNIVFPLQPGKP